MADHQGKCYCGALRFEMNAEPVMQAQCHCRECQYFSGGGANYFMVIPEAGFKYTSGTPKYFTRSDLEAPVTREFCSDCGTHIATCRPNLPMVILKVGTLEAPSNAYTPQLAIFANDKQAFHVVPEGIPCFQEMAPRK